MAWGDALVGIVADLTKVACVATVLAWFNRFAWPCELASHFRAQYAWVLTVGAAVLWVGGRRPEAIVAMAFALPNWRTLLPLYHRNGRLVSGNTLRVLSANLRLFNPSYERIKRLVQISKPDVVFLAEVNETQLDDLRTLRATYPFAKGLTLGERNFGIMVLSRLQPESAEVVRIGGHGLPSVVARLRWQERVLTVIGTHPVSPTTPRRLALRNRQLAAIGTFVARQREPVIVVGDLNTTSWSGAFQQLLAASGLQDSRIGFGLQPTWPAWMPLLRIPIDHCLISEQFVVRRRRVGAFVGSDHYPVVVEVSLRKEFHR